MAQKYGELKKLTIDAHAQAKGVFAVLMDQYHILVGKLNSLTIHDILEWLIYRKNVAWNHLIAFETFLNCQSAEEMAHEFGLEGCKD